jgi:hypothetical protein
MQHFDITQWTDFVRGLVPPSENDAMARHLAQECESCARLVALIERIKQEAAAEPVVPEALVLAAKAIFPAHLAAGVATPDWPLLPRLVAQLVQSSLTDLAPEGARTTSDATIQVMYHAGDYAIDLQVEREPDSSEVTLVGQIVNRAASGEPLADVPVWLMASKKRLAQSHTNRFGEFCLVAAAQRGLRLSIPIEVAGKQVEIPLTKIVAGCQ